MSIPDSRLEETLVIRLTNHTWASLLTRSVGVPSGGHAAGAVLLGLSRRLPVPGLHPALRAGGPVPGVHIDLRRQPGPDAGQPEEEIRPGCGEGEG